MSDSDTPPEVEFSAGPVVLITPALIERVRRAAAISPRRRARLCLHHSADDLLHTMLIVLCRGTEIAIHRHSNKAECYHVLSGQMTLRIHDDTGGIVQRIRLGDPATGQNSLCRISAGLWHSVEVETDEVILHESTTGPFRPGETEFLSSLPMS